MRANPAAGWAAQAVLDIRCAEHDWAGALAAIDSHMKSGLIDKPSFRRSRAVVYHGRPAEHTRRRIHRVVKLYKNIARDIL